MLTQGSVDLTNLIVSAANVAATETAGEVAMLPGMVEMIVSVVASGVVADPSSAAIDVRRVRMARVIVEVTIFYGRVRSLNVRGAAFGRENAKQITNNPISFFIGCEHPPRGITRILSGCCCG